MEDGIGSVPFHKTIKFFPVTKINKDGVKSHILSKFGIPSVSEILILEAGPK